MAGCHDGRPLTNTINLAMGAPVLSRLFSVTRAFASPGRGVGDFSDRVRLFSGPFDVLATDAWRTRSAKSPALPTTEDFHETHQSHHPHNRWLRGHWPRLRPQVRRARQRIHRDRPAPSHPPPVQAQAPT